MRALTVLTLNVSLAAFANGADWQTVHAEGLAAAKENRVSDAAAILQSSLDMARTPIEAAVSANDLGVMLHRLNRDRDAAPLLERALAVWRNSPNPGGRIVRTLGSLATVDRSLGEYAAAEKLIREALAVPVADPELRTWLHNMLADMFREEGRTAEAIRETETVFNTPDLSWRMRADALVARADLDRDTRDFQSSAADWNQVLELAREHGDTVTEAVATRGLGETLLEEGRTAQAEPLLRRALAMFEHSPHSTGHQMAATLSCMAQLYIVEDKLGLAEESVRRAIELDRRTLGPNHPQIGVLEETMADIMARRGQLAEARDHLTRASQIVTARFGENSAAHGAVLANWGTLEQRANHLGAAAGLYERSLAILRLAGPDVLLLRAAVMERYAMVLKAEHHKGEAKALLAQARSFRERN